MNRAFRIWQVPLLIHTLLLHYRWIFMLKRIKKFPSFIQLNLLRSVYTCNLNSKIAACKMSTLTKILREIPISLITSYKRKNKGPYGPQYFILNVLAWKTKTYTFHFLCVHSILPVWIFQKIVFCFVIERHVIYPVNKNSSLFNWCFNRTIYQNQSLTLPPLPSGPF